MKKLIYSLIFVLTGLTVVGILLFRSSLYKAFPAPSPRNTVTPAISEEAPGTTSPSPPIELRENCLTLSIAGNCTLGTQNGCQDSVFSFPNVIEKDMSYPFKNVAPYFQEDGLTLVNLEGVFSFYNTPEEKPCCFRVEPKYAALLPAGSVECVSLANDHTMDYGKEGYEDTKTNLDFNDVHYTSDDTACVYYCGSYIVGLISLNTVDKPVSTEDFFDALKEQYDFCCSINSDIVVAYLHWGEEDAVEPEPWQRELASMLAELGVDIIVGSHPLALQEMEYLRDVPVFYSLGTFCSGSIETPADKDSVIIQIKVYITKFGSLIEAPELIPCCISSTDDCNDFCPTPYTPGSEEYKRVIEKLNPESSLEESQAPS